jgi:hypothetical protein
MILRSHAPADFVTHVTGRGVSAFAFSVFAYRFYPSEGG